MSYLGKYYKKSTTLGKLEEVDSQDEEEKQSNSLARVSL
jgi:hypothetical protein